jgi:hypothetical protein
VIFAAFRGEALAGCPAAAVSGVGEELDGTAVREPASAGPRGCRGYGGRIAQTNWSSRPADPKLG